MIQFQYKKTEKGLEITGMVTHNKTNIDLVIPSEINGERVVAIGCSAFAQEKYIKSVIISEGVETIEDSAFSNCISLTKVEIPKSVTFIGEEAFANCVLLTKVIIPDGVTAINRFAFSYCRSLKEVVLPKTLVTIQGAAFEDCFELEFMDIPLTTQVHDNAFDGCILFLKKFNPRNHCMLCNSQLDKKGTGGIWDLAGEICNIVLPEVDHDEQDSVYSAVRGYFRTF